MKKFFQFKYFLILIAVIVIVLIGRQQISSARAKDPTNLNIKKDTIIIPAIQTITSELILAGSVSANEVASLRFPNSGKLVWVGVKVGDRVKKWQAIASLDKQQLKKSLQTQFNNYKTELSQFTDDQKTYIGTADRASLPDTIKRILDRTDYSLDNAVVSYEIADMAIQDATLVSPIAGVVTDIEQPLAGTYITPATATFTIINPESVFFKSEIDQEEVNKIKVGQSATIKIDAFPDISFESEITYISFVPVSGQSSTVYEVRFKLPIDNKNLSYRLGMDGDVQIILDKQSDALTVPIDAINDDNGKSFVWVKNDNKLVKTYVTTGIENDTDVQILEGLNSYDSVVIKKI